MTLQANSELHHAWRAAVASWDATRSTDRLWAGDASLWTAGDESRWLGWLKAPSTDDAHLASLTERVRAATPPDTREILLFGMGGSSLAAEVITRIVPAPGAPTLTIVDTTEPAAIADIFARTNWAHALVIVASKSGSTLEPDILLAAALDAARRELGAAAARRVIAITDPGSKLAVMAARDGFAGVVEGEPSIGGRYSALSPFGLVPAVLRGIPLDRFVKSARAMAASCRAPATENPGVQLGAFLGDAARAGRDKCTLILPGAFASLGAWIEQLVAESTGKHGVGIIPVDGESLGPPGVYGADRAFVHVRVAGARNDHGAAVDEILLAGHPVFTIDVAGTDALAGEFFRWEFATAVAGSILGVNPFDQPDVEASKVATRALTDALEQGRAAPAATLTFAGAIGFTPSATAATPAEALRVFLAQAGPGDYVALLAFLPMWTSVASALERTRHRIRDAQRVATSLGFGPRYLHSTGQAFKGGPNTGHFLVLTADSAPDVPIPGRALTFGAVARAQAAGDCQVLSDRGRHVLHLHLRGALSGALAELDAAVVSALT